MQRKTRHFRYSIYSIKDGGEKRARGISELRGQESSPWTHKSFVCKRRLISQAGRREFEDWLPLHKINSLQNTPESVLRLCSVNLSIAANRLKMGVLFTSHRAPLVGSAEDTTTAAFSYISGLRPDRDCQRDWKPAL